MTWRVDTGDCREVMARMEPESVTAIVTDPPYFKVKGEAWDRQWDKPDAFLSWLESVLTECRRVLKPNGSLYSFASPQMAARVECVIGKLFNVLNHIVWNKNAPQGRHKQACKDALRLYFPIKEHIIFAEPFGADATALGLSNYGAKCNELRGFVFEPLRAYLDGERIAAGVSRGECNRACGVSTMASNHYFPRSQWQLPTAEHYAAMRELFNRNGGAYLRREYEDLRREYEDLRREYEDLRRPFAVTAEDQYTDVWHFEPVQFYKGKHPCEKPIDLMRHIVQRSCPPGSIILDPFCGSGTTGCAAVLENCDFIGIEMNPEYADIARARIAHWEKTGAPLDQPKRNPAEMPGTPLLGDL